jgi:hypothetical protein
MVELSGKYVGVGKGPRLNKGAYHEVTLMAFF